MYDEDVHCEIDLWYRSKLRDVPLIITGVKAVVSCSSVNTVKADSSVVKLTLVKLVGS